MKIINKSEIIFLISKKTLLLFASFILMAFFISCGETERKSHKEAFTVIEQQEVTLEYIVKDGLYHHRTDAILAGFVSNPKMKVYCTVTNTTNYNGVFKLYATMSCQGDKIEFNAEEFIPAGSAKEISCEKEINPFSFEADVKIDNWGITPPTVTVAKEVTKYKTVYDD